MTGHFGPPPNRSLRVGKKSDPDRVNTESDGSNIRQCPFFLIIYSTDLYQSRSTFPMQPIGCMASLSIDRSGYIVI